MGVQRTGYSGVMSGTPAIFALHELGMMVVDTYVCVRIPFAAALLNFVFGSQSFRSLPFWWIFFTWENLKILIYWRQV